MASFSTAPLAFPATATTTAALLAVLVILGSLTASAPPKSAYHALFVSLSDNATVSRHLLALTRRPHVAGTRANAEAAAYVAAAFSSYSLRAHVASYEVLLTYPVRRSLTLARSPRDPPAAFELVQEVYPEDPCLAAAGEVIPTFHGFARSGTAAGPVVYADYGRVEDYAALRGMGVEVRGAVVLARYGKLFRGDIVRNAQEAGAVGAVLYTDRKDYGGGTEGKGFPEGPWMPPSGVQIGTVYKEAGDPTTPGWASAGKCERLSWEEVEAAGVLPRIPSLPVSARDGEEILRSVGGPVASEDWQGVEGGPVYHVGPGPGFLNLTYVGNQTMATIQNVFGVIEGEEEPDRYVLLGNHRDAWTFGAVDPNSGTAALLEVARRLKMLQKRGWKPRRTIILCNWDAEEYGLMGSTEWVEENREMLASKVVAYLNADSAVSGPGFHASATPQLDELLKQATKDVQSPDSSPATLYDSWVASNVTPLIGRLGGGGSDYAPFVQHVGIPSVDMLFGGAHPVYHSMYDDFTWMQKFGDPMFHRHVAVASIWGLVALRLADDEFLPFNYVSYAYELQMSTKELEHMVLGMPISFTPLYQSIEELSKAADKINNQKKALEASKWQKKSLKVRELNDRLMMAERAFTSPEGLFEHPWSKHLIYGPSKHNDYRSKSFPGIDDAIEKARSLNTRESWRFVQHEVWRAARAVLQASLVLNGEFS